MASVQLPLIYLAITLVFHFCHPAQCLPCKSQHKFTTENNFTNCGLLPYHNATLYWTYDRARSALSMAFVAAPPMPDGWVAWAINPSGTGMVGAQALIAFKQEDGFIEVKPFSIRSYHSVKGGLLSVNVSNISAEYDDHTRNMAIFGTWTLPENMPGTLNQVWQVGPSVVKGRPLKHEFSGDNLASKGKLHFLEKNESNKGDGSSANPPESQFGNRNGSVPFLSQKKNDAEGSTMIDSVLRLSGLVVSLAFAFSLH